MPRGRHGRACDCRLADAACRRRQCAGAGDPEVRCRGRAPASCRRRRCQCDLHHGVRSALSAGVARGADIGPAGDATDFHLMLATGRASTALPAGQKNSLVFLTLHNKFYEPAARLIRAGFPAEFNVGREQPMLVLFARSGDARAVGTLLDARIDPNQAIAGVRRR